MKLHSVLVQTAGGECGVGKNLAKISRNIEGLSKALIRPPSKRAGELLEDLTAAKLRVICLVQRVCKFVRTPQQALSAVNLCQR